MARRNARVEINRKAMGTVRLAIGDGVLEVANRIIEIARPPDAEPYGVGLVTSGAAGAWIDGKKIGGKAQKPRRERLPKPGIVALAGWGFPARFQEIGTIYHDAQPFAWPAALRVIPRIPDIMRPAVRARLAR